VLFRSAGRGLTAETVKKYKVAESGNKIVFPYLRDKDLIFVKYLNVERDNGKKKISTEAGCEPCLFGWQAINSKDRQVTICEGEIDAMTCYQYGFPALSVPFGGGAGAKQQWIENEFENLAQFDTIYIFFDADEAGEQAVKEVCERLGRHRCRVVRTPHKDANECLKLGVTQSQFFDYFTQAKTQDPAGLRDASDFFKEVCNEFYPLEDNTDAYSTPFEKANGKIGFRPSELSIWTGYSGHGKTTMLNQVILHTLKVGLRACVASLEVKPRKLISKMIRQMTGEVLPNPDLIKEKSDWLSSKLWVFDYVGSTKTETLLEVFKYARLRYGIDHFVIDSLMKCGVNDDDYNAQKAFVDALCDFKTEHNVHIHLVAHSRKTASEDILPGKLGVKGSGTITDLADNVFTVWRNKKKESDDAQKNFSQADLDSLPDLTWYCDKQRNGEWEGAIPLWWDRDSMSYTDEHDYMPKKDIEQQKHQNSQTYHWHKYD
jgi:twinkle protein